MVLISHLRKYRGSPCFCPLTITPESGLCHCGLTTNVVEMSSTHVVFHRNMQMVN